MDVMLQTVLMMNQASLEAEEPTVADVHTARGEKHACGIIAMDTTGVAYSYKNRLHVTPWHAITEIVFKEDENDETE